MKNRIQLDTCIICSDQSFAQRQRLKEHKFSKHEDEVNQIHKGQGNSKCDICHKTFSAEKLLKIHLSYTLLTIGVGLYSNCSSWGT